MNKRFESMKRTEETMTCDVCDEEWEVDFFCDRCSHRGEFVEVLRPSSWDVGYGSEMEWDVEWLYMSICLNCCDCYLRGNR